MRLVRNSPVERSQIPVLAMPIQAERFAWPRLISIFRTVSRHFSTILATRMSSGIAAGPNRSTPIPPYF
jgi:hypothetical protein